MSESVAFFIVYGNLLEEPCPVVLYICIVHHHRHYGLERILHHTYIVGLGVILGVEGAGVAAVDPEDIDSIGTLHRSADNILLSGSNCADECRVKSLGIEGTERN